MLYYRDHPFEYEPSAGKLFHGRLVLDDEDENWYLNDDGERWPAEELFSRSLWSWRSPSGTLKLLHRLLDYRDGRTWFSTPDTYGGELFRWMRKPKET